MALSSTTITRIGIGTGPAASAIVVVGKDLATTDRSLTCRSECLAATPVSDVVWSMVRLRMRWLIPLHDGIFGTCGSDRTEASCGGAGLAVRSDPIGPLSPSIDAGRVGGVVCRVEETAEADTISRLISALTPGSRSVSSTGRDTRNTVPRSPGEISSRLPPRAQTSVLVICSPSPIPGVCTSCFVKGSRRRGIVSSSMPGPWSVIVNWS
jgi:hypothetical protein